MFGKAFNIAAAGGLHKQASMAAEPKDYLGIKKKNSKFNKNLKITKAEGSEEVESLVEQEARSTKARALMCDQSLLNPGD